MQAEAGPLFSVAFGYCGAEENHHLFYGGSWASGHRQQYKFVAEALTSAGYDVVIPDYRVYPEVRLPDFVHGAGRVVGWVKQSIAQYGGNPEKVFVAGHSAGAHIAALLALDESYLAQV